MRRWFVFIGNDDTEYECELVRAFPVTKQLMLKLDGKEFFINFETQDDYMEAKNCIKKSVFISNKSKTLFRKGFAVFKPLKKC